MNTEARMDVQRAEEKFNQIFTNDTLTEKTTTVVSITTEQWKSWEAIVEFLDKKTFKCIVFEGKNLIRDTFPTYIASKGFEGYSKATLQNIEVRIFVKKFLADTFNRYSDYPTSIKLCKEMKRWINAGWGYRQKNFEDQLIFKRRFCNIWTGILKEHAANLVTPTIFKNHSDATFPSDILDKKELDVEQYFGHFPKSGEEIQYLVQFANESGTGSTHLVAKEQAAKEQAAKEQAAKDAEALALEEQAAKDAEALALEEQAAKDTEALALGEQAAKDTEALAATELELKKLVQQLEETSKRMREDSDLSETLIRQIKIVKKW